ncbi:MAG: CDP-diacylglycerol--serine O-phosphatidyltransferase [Saprospiraceae bacterium]
MRTNLPNILTVLNLLCGCMAIVCVLDNDFQLAFVLIFIGGMADYFDGMVARLLNVHSPFGKELDSLADMVSFGVFPAMILYVLLRTHGGPMIGPLHLIGVPAFLLAGFACIRLAKFNLDTRQAYDFIGMPTPSCTLFIVGLMLIHHHDSFGLGQTITSPYILYPVIAIFSYLLVSEIRMFSFKFKSKKWKGNEDRIVFLILGVVLLIFLREVAFSLMILLYVIYAIYGRLVKGGIGD